MDTVAGGHEPEVNPQIGDALLTAIRGWIAEGTADEGPGEPGANDGNQSDEEVA